MGLRRSRAHGSGRRGARGGGRGGGRGFAIGFFVALFLLLAGVYAAGYALTNQRIPRGVEVAGVDIGGLRPPGAEDKLRRVLVPRAHEPVVVRRDRETYEVVPAQAGLTLDVAATVDAAGGRRTLNPLRMIEVLTGGDDVEPVVDVDVDALDAAIVAMTEQVNRAPVEGAVRFVGGRAEAVYPTPGLSLDESATARMLQEHFLDPNASFDLPVRRIPTRLDDADVDRAMSRFAEPAMSGPVTLETQRGSARVGPATIGGALTMEARDGELVPRLDEKKLAERAAGALDRLTREPRPASVVLRGGAPQIVEGRTGTAIDTGRLARRLLRVLPETDGPRTVRIDARTVRPRFGTRDARQLGISEVVSEFTTVFPHSDYRNTNLGRAAEKINGTVLRPGDVFSLNDIVGERTAENGFTKGTIIVDGVLVEDFGGGVSQVATTTYNAAFFAGLKDVEHHPHSLYFDRYPMGREATVAWGALDLRFGNNTPYGVLVQAWIEPSTPSSQGEMHVRMWSTDYWDIEAGLSEQYDFTRPEVRYSTEDDCVEQTGFRGFEVDVFRHFHRGGERVKTQKEHVVYDAADTIRCRPAPPGFDG